MVDPGARILIVDDDKDICAMLSQLVMREGLKPTSFNEGEPALEMIRSLAPDVVLLDIQMPGMDGLEVLENIRELDPDIPVIMITAYSNLRGAVGAIKAGAHDYLSKPFENNEVIRVVHRALKERALKRQLSTLTSHLRKDSPLREIMGPSDAVDRLIGMVDRVSKTDFTVIILGETGSGKEVVARAIHNTSLRSKMPFVPVDCGAIPETLLESELFGHEKGAFTGAHEKRIGKIVSANGGTLFLDEISNLPLASQAKLLRVLQEKTVHPIGAAKSQKIDVRFLTASNEDLYHLSESGGFRKDLFFRLDEFDLKVPPLRERVEDILYLARRFLDITNAELDKNVQGFSGQAHEMLVGHDWPGNVRELRSVIRQAVLMADDLITVQHLNVGQRSQGAYLSVSAEITSLATEGMSLKDIVKKNSRTVEREVLNRMLKHTGGNKAKAARMLKIDYKTIHTKIKQLGIENGGGHYE